jgi:hypothetical protein
MLGSFNNNVLVYQTKYAEKIVYRRLLSQFVYLSLMYQPVRVCGFGYPLIVFNENRFVKPVMIPREQDLRFY